MFHRPVIPLLIAFIAGIISANQFSGYPLLACVTAIIASCIICYKILAGKDAIVAPISLMFVMGYLILQPWITPFLSNHHISQYAGKEQYIISGHLGSHTVKREKRTKLVLRVDKIQKGRELKPVTGNLSVSVNGDLPELFKGDHISFPGRIRKPRNFNNPGAFDYKRYLAFKGIRAVSYVRGENIRLIKKAKPDFLSAWIRNVRNRISNFIENRLEDNTEAVMKALIVGDRSGIPQFLKDRFHRAGAGHLLAISGLHIGIIATIAFFIFKWLLGRFRILLIHAHVRKCAALLSLIPIIFYGIIAGLSPSTQRALIMVAVFLIAFLFERRNDPINTIAIAAMVILIIHPPSLFTVSFQLSFIAVISIIYGLSGSSAVWSKTDGFLSNFRARIVLYCFTSLLAILGTFPITVYYFNQVSIIGLISNMILIPLVGFIVVPLGLLSACMSFLNLSLASLVLSLGAMALDLALNCVVIFGDIPHAHIKLVTPTLLEIGIFYVAGGLFLKILNTGITDGSQSRMPCIRAGEKAILMILFFIAATDAIYWSYQRYWHNDLRVTIVDVGQGNCALVELPEGHCILIDGGGFYDNRIFNVGSAIVAPLLWRKKIAKIDTIILTHSDSDHLNGLLFIAENFSVDTLWTNHDESDSESYGKLMQIAREKNIRVPALNEILGRHHINNVHIDVLYPPADFKQMSTINKWRNDNNNSLVTRIAFGSRSFVFPGDIMSDAEKELVAMHGENLSADVLMAPHHGSRTSTTSLFLDHVKPEYFVISAGWKNRFRYPHKAVVQRCEKRQCRILRTDIHGAIEIITDGTSLNVVPTIDG